LAHAETRSDAVGELDRVVRIDATIVRPPACRRRQEPKRGRHRNQAKRSDAPAAG